MIVTKLYCPCEIKKLVSSKNSLYLPISGSNIFFSEIREKIMEHMIIDEAIGIPLPVYEEKFDKLEQDIIKISPDIVEIEEFLWLVLSVHLKKELNTEEKESLKKYVSEQIKEFCPIEIIIIDKGRHDFYVNFEPMNSMRGNLNILTENEMR